MGEGKALGEAAQKANSPLGHAGFAESGQIEFNISCIAHCGRLSSLLDRERLAEPLQFGDLPISIVSLAQLAKCSDEPTARPGNRRISSGGLLEIRFRSFEARQQILSSAELE